MCRHLPPVRAGVFAQTFKRLAARGVRPGVLHPAVSIPTDAALTAAEAAWWGGLPPQAADFMSVGPTFLSINRFERKKGIDLAIRALAQLKQQAVAQPEAQDALAEAAPPELR